MCISICICACVYEYSRVHSNEKLQLHFNTVVFDTEMGMYREEEVPTDKVDYRDNSQCVELIEGRPFSLVDYDTLCIELC